MPTLIEIIGRDTSRKYSCEPKKCPSTHGGAGWPLGTQHQSDGTHICPICGAIIRHRIVSWEEFQKYG